jgi:hypothetical protein
MDAKSMRLQRLYIENPLGNFTAITEYYIIWE